MAGRARRRFCLVRYGATATGGRPLGRPSPLPRRKRANDAESISPRADAISAGGIIPTEPRGSAIKAGRPWPCIRGSSWVNNTARTRGTAAPDPSPLDWVSSGITRPSPRDPIVPRRWPSGQPFARGDRQVDPPASSGPTSRASPFRRNWAESYALDIEIVTERPPARTPAGPTRPFWPTIAEAKTLAPGICGPVSAPLPVPADPIAPTSPSLLGYAGNPGEAGQTRTPLPGTGGIDLAQFLPSTF